MVDLAEATITMSYLLLAEKKFSESNPKGIISYESRLAYYKANTAEYGNRLAAMPQFFDILESWLVTVIGKQGISSETMNEVVKTNDSDSMLERAGALATSVRDYFKTQDYTIRNIGAGEDGWDMCVRCTEKKSRTLCFDLQQRFQKAISLRLMNVSRRFGGHYLPGLYTYDDAERMLKLYGKNLDIGEVL